MQNAIAVREEGFLMKPKTLAEAMELAKLMATSTLIPASFKDKPGDILLCIQMGMEIGMNPFQALRSIAVINGRATIWGDAMLALVLASPVCEYVREEESTSQRGVCRVKRKDDPQEHISVFTLEDAKRAGLLGKQGPWQQHTGRMLKLRARGFALRDKFADVLAGLVSYEEAIDYAPEETSGPTDGPPTAPVTLKDRLKEQVDQMTAQEQEPLSVPSEGEGASGIEEAPSSPVETPDAPQTPPDQIWKDRLTNAPDSKTVNKIWREIPEDLKPDCYRHYSDVLKSLKGK